MHRTVSTILAATALAAAAVGADAADIKRPDKVVVIIMQDRFSDVIGKTWANGEDGYVMPFITQLAESSLVYTDSHGVAHPSLPNTLALFSGSTHDETGNGANAVYGGETLATRIDGTPYSFAGFSESLPYDGAQVDYYSDVANFPDLYSRNINPMAQFTSVDGGVRAENPDVNRSFDSFPTDYSQLPTISYVIPNNLHNTHGSSQQDSGGDPLWPWAGSSDEEDNDLLRSWADDWLEQHFSAYFEWAKENNSLLIITQDEERYTGGTASTITTLVTGDTDLFEIGINDQYVNHYNLLRTLTDMYGLAPLGESVGVSSFAITADGKLAAVPEPAALSLFAAAGLLLARRRKRTEACA